MRAVSRSSLAFIAVVIAAWPPPTLAVGNHAALTVEAPNSAAASCQVFILVNSLVILEMEDSLALVTLPAGASLGERVRSLSVHEGSIATCSTIIDRVVLHVPAELGLSSSFVSGPALASEPIVVVTGANSDADACHYALMVDSIVIGGGAFGLPTGETGGMVTFASPLSHGGAASCEAGVGEVVIEEDA